MLSNKLTTHEEYLAMNFQAPNALVEQFQKLKQELSAQILGQETFVERLLIALLADGHLLVEGAPGLAKTTAIKELAKRIEGNFVRIQFTPDLLPADITGSDIYRPQSGEFVFQAGPIFHQIVLADEINRAPPKVQSALLQAMAERQVSVGGKDYALPRLFLVMATQNPLEQEGTYPLPEAQLDRFLLYVRLGYPNAEHEKGILRLARQQINQPSEITIRLTENDIFQARQAMQNLYCAEAFEEYLVQLVMATRHPEKYGQDLENLLAYGASPRGSIALERTARARAWLQRRDYLAPEDIQALATDVLSHRIGLTYAAQANGWTARQVIDMLLKRVPVV
jgi:MoxR-like ATPase